MQQDNATVFFVDDSSTDRTRGAGLIQKVHPHWKVLTFDNATEALRQVEPEKPDVIISDLIMPEMDGREFLLTMRKHYPLIPVVLITAEGDDRIAAEIVELGAVNYVPKRLMADRLVSILDDVMLAEKEIRTTRNVLQYIRKNHFQFEIASDLDQIRTLVNYVRERLQATELFRPDRIENMTTAVRESLLNAHFHGNMQVNSGAGQGTHDEYVAQAAERRQQPEFAARRIRMSMSLETSSIEFRIEDDGAGFDTSRIDQLTEHSTDVEAENGLKRILASMKSVVWNDTGNVVTLGDTVERS